MTTNKKDSKPDNKTNHYSWIGFVLTSIYAFVVIMIVCGQWDEIIKMTPNEWGDFLAGVFGPLALLWVVLGFLQQGVELKNSREALLLQAEELKNSVEAQKDLGKAAWAQVAENQAARELDKRRKNLEAIERMKPIIIMRSIRGGTKSGKKFVNFIIENKGNTCLNISISFLNSNYYIPSLSIGKIDRDQTIKFASYVNLNDVYKEDILSISFEDIKGKKYKRAYNITPRDGRIPDIDLAGYQDIDC